MDHILWITVKDPPREEMGLVCVATGQGPVDVQETRLYLHKAIAGALAGGPWQEDPILQLDVVQSDEAEFQRAREAQADKVRDESAFHLIVQCGAAAKTRRKVPNSRGSARNRRDPNYSGGKRRRSDSGDCGGPASTAGEVAGDDHGDVAGPPRAVADNAAATPMRLRRQCLHTDGSLHFGVRPISRLRSWSGRRRSKLSSL